MTALFVLENLSNGGAQKVISTIFPLVDRSLKPELIVLKREQTYDLDLSDKRAVHRFDASRILSSVPRLAWFLLKRRPKVVVSSIFFSDLVIYCLARIFSPSSKLVFRSCNYFSKAYPDRTKLLPRLVLWAYRGADIIICSTKAMRGDFIRLCPQLEDKIRVIPNPVNLENIRRLSEQDSPAVGLTNNGKYTFVSVAKLKRQKNLGLLIDAFSRIADDHTQLIIAGKGPEEEMLKAKISDLGLEEKVHFVGFVKNPYALLAQADCSVLSSEYEGFPNALIEAMAIGLPVISTDCPSGPSEIITNQFNGILTPVGDSQALADAMLCVRNDRELSQSLSRNGHLEVKRFEASVVSALLSNVIRELT